METPMWHKAAKAAISVDLVLSLLTILLFVICSPSDILVPDVLVNDDNTVIVSQAVDDTFYLFGVWLLLVIYLGVLAGQIWAAFQLLQTIIDKPDKVAELLWRSHIWRNVTFFHLILGAVYHVCSYHAIYMFIETIVRFFIVIVVSMFIRSMHITIDARLAPTVTAQKV